ncbi:MAG: putative transaldolase [Chlamydiia bacterium]|nr:putative transaldolase [Chlamydiia bacterium]MCH9615934.1 putative transaldolase [Chlamydiia bacterium]MCH9628663.1 putative transaldolase [Chlamydiia bacterium]
MEIWLDTIDLDAIEHASDLGLISGVTTNPSILSKAEDVPLMLRRLLEVQQGLVAAQVTGSKAEQMVEEGLKISGVSERMVVKVPINQEGLKAIKELRQKGVPIMGTAVISSHQAVLASQHDLAYLAPYFSHIGTPNFAWSKIDQMQKILENTGCGTKILMASLREVEELVQAAALGIPSVTITAAMYKDLTEHQERVVGFMERFSVDWKKAQGDVSIKDVLV